MVSPTTVLACWGAGLSTIVFLWDIYKYRKAGPKLRFEVSANIVLIPSSDKRTFVRSQVTNYGDRPTTLMTIGIYYFAKRCSLNRLRNRATKSFVADDLNTSQNFPWELKEGSMWTGLTEQLPELEEMGRKGDLEFALYHSHDKRPIRCRVRFPDPHRFPSKP